MANDHNEIVEFPTPNAPADADGPAGTDYLRRLIDTSGLSIRECARRLGVSRRSLDHWLDGTRRCPYTAEYCLKVLAAFGRMRRG